jgi:hypothetical protein
MAGLLNLDLTTDISRAAGWSAALAKQLPFAISKALNDTAFDAKTSLSGATRQYFDKPTTFTQKGFGVEKSTKRELEVVVGTEVKRARYLRTQITGGLRGIKPFEGRIGEGRLVPGAGARLNASGNVSLAAIRKITAGLGTDYFVAKPGNKQGIGPGIYQRKGRTIKPMLVMVERANYSPRFPMLDVVSKVYERRYGMYFKSALERALATAR